MGGTLKKVRSGDPLAIPAAAYNLFIDAARDFQRRAHGLGQGSVPSFRQATVVPVRNNTGADRSRFHVVGLQPALIGRLRRYVGGLARHRLDEALGYTAVPQPPRPRLALVGPKVYVPGRFGRVELTP